MPKFEIGQFHEFLKVERNVYVRMRTNCVRIKATLPETGFQGSGTHINAPFVCVRKKKGTCASSPFRLRIVVNAAFCYAAAGKNNTSDQWLMQRILITLEPRKSGNINFIKTERRVRIVGHELMYE